MEHASFVYMAETLIKQQIRPTLVGKAFTWFKPPQTDGG
jgi:hypothetical protein